MIWLRDPYSPRAVRRFTDSQRLAIALVMAEVHPGNLGALPPSPGVLLGKAVQIGILTVAESV